MQNKIIQALGEHTYYSQEIGTSFIDSELAKTIVMDNIKLYDDEIIEIYNDIEKLNLRDAKEKLLLIIKRQSEETL